MEFNRFTLQELLAVHKLISFHYFEYAKGFAFEGEQHDFWELLYVDKGAVEVRADERLLELTQGMIVFHKPDEFHTVNVKETHKPPNLVVLSFECRSSCMERFNNRVMRLGAKEQQLLSLILQEGFEAFLPPFDHPGEHRLRRNPHAPVGAEQAFRAYLEVLLIQLLRKLEQEDGREAARRPVSLHAEKAEEKLISQIVDYMKGRLSESLKLDELCEAVHLGKSRLKEIFLARMGMGPIEYFKQLKIEEAKTLIREQHYNYTQIADRLGYASIHYFSRSFKQATGMSPSEYARSVKARAASLS